MDMTIEAELTDALKDAMRAKDKALIACIRQVKSKIQEAVNAKGFKGEVDDALYQNTIGTYIKSLKKGIEELEAAGPRSDELRASYAAEIAYLDKFLPQLKSEAETRELVKAAIAQGAVTDIKQIGKVMGLVMKDHKGQVDAGLVRTLAEQELSPA
jgi:uncharacterized protein YqeY